MVQQERSNPSAAHWAWRTAALCGVLWTSVHALGWLGPLSSLTQVLSLLMPVAAIIMALRIYRPRVRWPWLMLVLSFVVWFMGGALRTVLGTMGDLTADRSLLPDAVTIPGYVLASLSCLGFNRARSRRHDLDALLDGVIPALVALLGAWVFLIGPALAKEHVPLRVRLVLACYPAMSVLVLAMAARVGFLGSQRSVVAVRLFVGAVVCVLAGDVLYMVADAHIAAVPLLVIDVPYVGASICVGLAALHPTMRELTEPSPLDESAPGRWRILLVSAMLGLPALVAVTRPRTGADGLFIVGLIGALTVMGTWRVFRALRDHAAVERRLLHQATHDSVTGLPNRLYVMEHLAAALRTRSEERSVAVIFVDIDRFKLVNDTGGHSVGDQLLRAVARRMVENTAPGDIVARVGGDEFVVVSTGALSLTHAHALAERLHQSFQTPFTIEEQQIFTSASLGVSFAQHNDADATGDTLLRNADIAMYEAKQAGRDGVAVFDESMSDRVAERVALEQELRVALVASEIHANYQPIVDSSGQKVVGFEALMRWQHPQRGLVPPVKFVPIAEENGLIVEFGLFMLNEACRELVRWRRLPGHDRLTVSVNLSPRQLRDSDLVSAVDAILGRHGLPGDALCLELTESVLMEDPERAEEMLRKLRALGVRLSIDDFGTGYSSLAYLKRFPVNQVKIDKSFVDGLADPNSSEASLVAAIIAMARALNLTTVAEGVELPVQAKALEELGCDRIQGFLFSRPVMAHLVPPTIERLEEASRITTKPSVLPNPAHALRRSSPAPR